MNSASIKPLISTSDLDKIDVRIGGHSRCRGRGAFGDAPARQVVIDLTNSPCVYRKPYPGLLSEESAKLAS